MNHFLSFGRPEIPHEPRKTARTDLPLALPAKPTGADLVKAAVGAVERIWRFSQEKKLKRTDLAVGGPEHPGLAVALAAVIEGFEDEPKPLWFPRLIGDPPVWVYDLGDFVKTGELVFQGVELREQLRGTRPDLSPLPRPAKTRPAAFVCFGDPAAGVAGRKADRVDVPVRVPASAEELAPGEHPHGWDLMTGGAAFQHGPALVATLEARQVILGLPASAGLAVTIACTWEKFYFDDPPRIAWPADGIYDLDAAFDFGEAREAGRKLRRRLATL